MKPVQNGRKLNRNLTLFCKFLQHLLVESRASKCCMEFIPLLFVVEGISDPRGVWGKLVSAGGALKKSEMDERRNFWIYGTTGFIVTNCFGQGISVVDALTQIDLYQPHVFSAVFQVSAGIGFASLAALLVSSCFCRHSYKISHIGRLSSPVEISSIGDVLIQKQSSVKAP